MSVTFAPEFVDSEHTIRCWCGQSQSTLTFPTRQAAYEALTNGAHGLTCPDEYCAAEYRPGYPTPVNETPEVNMSNVNADMLLEALGIGIGEDFSDYCCGSMDARDFLGRVLLAQALTPLDAGIPAHALPGTNARVINCGRPAGYTQDRLDALHKIGMYAFQHNLKVVWA